jgi:hypothetical protein
LFPGRAAFAAEDWASRTSVGLDLGLGSVITRYSTDAMPGGSVFFLSLRGGLQIQPAVTLQLTLQQWSLPADNHATMPGLGVRYEPYQDEYGRAHVDGTLGVAFTKDQSNIGFDLGAGYELDLPTAPGLALGVFLRYGQVINPSSLSDEDGRAWAGGISANFNFGRAAAAEAARKAAAPARPAQPFAFKVVDSDHDGVTDDADQCPDVPAGRHPDPFRPGCPENDEDQDGIPDSDDRCPLIAAGDHPDKARPGCPFVDSDGDGIPDADDHCPDKPGPSSPDSLRNGCPVKKPKARTRAKPTPEDLSAPAPTRKRRLPQPATPDRGSP